MQYLKEVFSSRELLLNLTMREVRGKYKRTVFGQLWSLANPIASMLVYTLVFWFFLRIKPDVGDPSGIDIFAIWLLCGLLPFIFLSNVINDGMASLVQNANLVQKVYFSRIVLPLAMVGSVGFNWLFEMGVLVVALMIVGAFVLPWLPLVLVVMILLAVFGTGLALMLSVANVYFRDTQYFVSIALQIWMYMTPIIYPVSMVSSKSNEIGGLFGTTVTLLDLYKLNPLESFVGVFRNLLYDNRWPDAGAFLTSCLWAFGVLVIGVWVFRKNERNLAELL